MLQYVYKKNINIINRLSIPKRTLDNVLTKYFPNKFKELNISDKIKLKAKGRYIHESNKIII